LINCPYCHSPETTHQITSNDFFLSKENFNVVSCKSCQLWFTDPRPEPESLGKYYESDQYISHDDSKSGVLGTLYKFVRQFALTQKEKLAKKNASGNTILDFGCGSGAFLQHLKDKKWNVTGVEFDDKTRTKVVYNTNIQVEKETATFQEKSFHIITAWHVLEHVYELRKTFSELNRILKPNGKLIIAVPNHLSYDSSRYKEFWAALDVPRHLYHFDVHSIKMICEENGFRLLNIKPMVFDSFYISLISSKYKYRRFNIIEAFWIGLISNIRATKKTPNHSSLIYILEKNS